MLTVTLAAVHIKYNNCFCAVNKYDIFSANKKNV